MREEGGRELGAGGDTDCKVLRTQGDGVTTFALDGNRAASNALVCCR